MNHTAGSSTTQAPIPTSSCAVRQPYSVTSQPASGAMVIGATPMPAETSATARLRCLSNDAAVAAMMGAKKLPAATPVSTPKHSWNASRLVARLASTAARPSSTMPASTTRRGP